MLEDLLKSAIRDVNDFPKKGIIFKDITPIFSDPELCNKIIDEMERQIKPLDIDVLACLEARGFLFGPLLAQRLAVPFIPLRKSGKLPYKTFSQTYDLEYGSATIEMHQDAIKPGQRVLIHDDLLATGGTAVAGAELVKKIGDVVGFSFLIELSFLNGRKKIDPISDEIHTLVTY